MTKKDFIIRLRRALSGKLNGTEIAEHASYYEEYIEIQVRKGKEEWQVTEELGDPALLAKSILSAEQDGRARLAKTKTLARLLTSLPDWRMHMRSACLNLGHGIKQKAKDWFEGLR